MHMKVVIDDTYFSMSHGKRLLKTRYPACVVPSIRRQWDDLRPMGFTEILNTFEDPHERSVAIHCLPLSALLKDVSGFVVSHDSLSQEICEVNGDGSMDIRQAFVHYRLLRIPLSQLDARIGIVSSDETEPDQWFVLRHEVGSDIEHIRWLGSVDPDYVSSPLQPLEALSRNIRTFFAEGDISRIVWKENGVHCLPRFGAFRQDASRCLTAQEYRDILYSSVKVNEDLPHTESLIGKHQPGLYKATHSADPNSWKWTGNLHSYIKVTCFFEPEDRSLLEEQIYFSNDIEGIMGERLFHFKSDGILDLRTVRLLDKVFRTMHSAIDSVREQVMWPKREKLKSSPIPTHYDHCSDSNRRAIDRMSRGAGSVIAHFGREGIELFVSVY
jgi:hypothetical protein